MSGWISVKEKSPTEKIDHADHVHCWCAVKRVHSNTYFVEHLAWNPYHQCWDGEDEDDVSQFDSMVWFWQPLDIPEPPTNQKETGE